MTRFQMEISGKFGDWWKKNAEKEVSEALEKASNDAIVEEDGKMFTLFLITNFLGTVTPALIPAINLSWPFTI